MSVINPGPGTYNPDSAYVGNATPRYSLGMRLESPKRATGEIPGPGAYDPLAVLRKEPRISIKGKIPSPRANTDVPGPGAYNLEISKDGKFASIKGKAHDPDPRKK